MKYISMINQILDSNDFYELSENLDLFIDYADDNYNEQKFYKAFYDEIKKAIVLNNRDFIILSGKDCIPSYLLSNWTFREKGEDNYSNLLAIVLGIRDNYLFPYGKKIERTQILLLLELAEQKFGFCSKILRKNPIDILLVKNTLNNANGLYCVNPHVGNEGRDTIILTYVADNRVSPEFAFLHELGHALHTRLTNKLFVPPVSFDFLQNLMFKQLIDKPKSEWAECFSEAFAIAVLQDTPFVEYDYYNRIKEADKKIISAYIEVLMKTTDENIDGQYSWQELLYLFEQKYHS